MINTFWSGRRVLVTGHTGFKGGWLVAWLKLMGAEVCGFALHPNTTPSFYDATNLSSGIENHFGDIRDINHLSRVINNFSPEIIFHLAAQPLVRRSYLDPIETYSTNVMGLINLYEAVKKNNTVKVLINVTSDKCYENREMIWSYREGDVLGGYDPYSNSKACAELVTSSYRNSFLSSHGVNVATARAGNVIGGGDWSEDRLIPDIFRAIASGDEILIRSPQAIRPWQHVLEPISGYLLLAEKIYLNSKYAEAWNFGPLDEDSISVKNILLKIKKKIEGDYSLKYRIEPSNLHEASLLKLDSTKSRCKLGWKTYLTIEQSIDWTVQWYKSFYASSGMASITESQIRNYLELIE